jgi:hypothetical protein
MADQDYYVISDQLYRQLDGKYDVPCNSPQVHEVLNLFIKEHPSKLMNAGRDKTGAEIDPKSYDITNKEVAMLCEHCATIVKTRSSQFAAPLESIIVTELWERHENDLTDFWHLGQIYKWSFHIRDHFRKVSAAYLMGTNESESVALHLGEFIGIFRISSILQCENGSAFKRAWDQLVQHHGIPVIPSKPHMPQTHGLIEQVNGVL